MVKTELVSFTDGIAKINCYPEGNKNDVFQLEIDVVKQIILNNTLKKKGNPYAIHVAWKMYDLYEENGTLPESTTVIWC